MSPELKNALENASATYNSRLLIPGLAGKLDEPRHIIRLTFEFCDENQEDMEGFRDELAQILDKSGFVVDSSNFNENRISFLSDDHNPSSIGDIIENIETLTGSVFERNDEGQYLRGPSPPPACPVAFVENEHDLPGPPASPPKFFG